MPDQTPIEQPAIPGAEAGEPGVPLTRRAARESGANRFAPDYRRRRIVFGIVTGLVIVAIASVIGVFVVIGQGAGDVSASPSPSSSRTPTRSPSPSPTPTPTPTPTEEVTPIADIDSASSLTVVVNKQRPLNPADYAPAVVPVPVPYVNEPYLRQEAASAVVEMFAAITAETGLQLQVQSSYRSYDTQVSVYNGYVGSLGQEAADLTSARPGHSEHQTGLAVDLNALPDQGCALEPCWGGTPHAQWVAANAWRFGFIVRYQDGQTPITGYEYEPYHLRFVGGEIATAMHDGGILTLEQYFGLGPAASY